MKRFCKVNATISARNVSKHSTCFSKGHENPGVNPVNNTPLTVQIHDRAMKQRNTHLFSIEISEVGGGIERCMHGRGSMNKAGPKLQKANTLLYRRAMDQSKFNIAVDP